jgi:hypothetical protein
MGMARLRLGPASTDVLKSKLDYRYEGWNGLRELHSGDITLVSQTSRML